MILNLATFVQLRVVTKSKVLFSVDPDTPPITRVTDITETSVTISWSVGQTGVVNATLVYYRATGSAEWTSVSVTGTIYTVSSLQPGTLYQFYVQVNSYGKTSTSANVTATTVTTGTCRAATLFSCLFVHSFIYFRQMRSIDIDIKTYIYIKHTQRERQTLYRPNSQNTSYCIYHSLLANLTLELCNKVLKLGSANSNSIFVTL